MKKSGRGPKVIQICGLRGIFLALFVVICLVAGFVVFPAKVAMYTWNYVATTYISLPEISLWQGGLLWTMIALGGYILNSKKMVISFQQPAELSEDEMRVLMDRIRMQKQAQQLSTMIVKSQELKQIINPQKEAASDNNTQSSEQENVKENQL